MRTKANETSPIEKVAPTIKRTGKSAAGIPAIISTAKHSIPNMGVIRSLTTLSKVNKFSGFDCPGCAWPDPDHKRSFAEFCENGAKSIADEATKKRADSKFWSKWKLSELSKNIPSAFLIGSVYVFPLILPPELPYKSILLENGFL